MKRILLAVVAACLFAGPVWADNLSGIVSRGTGLTYSSGSGGSLSGLVTGTTTGTARDGALATAAEAAAQTTANNAVALDDPNNTIYGLGAQAVVRGQINILKLAGVVVGAGQTTGVRGANATALQAAITSANTSGLELDCPTKVTIEIDNTTGLVVPAGTGFRARLNNQCNIVQFHANAPILTLGDSSGAALTVSMDWQGGQFNYGASQTGNTAANCVTLGAMANSHVSDILACTVYGSSAPLNPPYNGFQIGTSAYAGAQSFFSDTIERIVVGGAQSALFGVYINGTGSFFNDIYIHNGSSSASAQTISGQAFIVNANGTRSDDVWNRINIEHAVGTNPIFFQNVTNIQFNGLHVEDIQISGYGTHLILATGAQIQFNSTELLDIFTPGSPSAVQLIDLQYSSQLAFKTLVMKWGAASEFTSAGAQFFPGATGRSPATDQSAFTLEDFQVSDIGGNNASNIIFEPAIPTTLSVLTRVGKYVYDVVMPYMERGQFTLAASTSAFTLYGQQQLATVFSPATVSTTQTITLADTRKASGTGSTMSTAAGNNARFHRIGTPSGTVLVKDGAATTLLTSASVAGTASFATNVMTAATPTSGVFVVGQTVTATGVTTGTTITSFGTGTGASGTYNLSTTPGTIVSEAVSAVSPSDSDNIFVANGTHYVASP